MSTESSHEGLQGSRKANGWAPSPSNEAERLRDDFANHLMNNNALHNATPDPSEYNSVRRVGEDHHREHLSQIGPSGHYSRHTHLTHSLAREAANACKALSGIAGVVGSGD